MNHWDGMLNDMAADRKLRNVIAEYDATIELWDAANNKLQGELNQKDADFRSLFETAKKLKKGFDELLEENRKLHKTNYEYLDKLTTESADATNERYAHSQTKRELAELEQTNAMNYAEKKAYAAYARELRNASDLGEVFDPILYSGDKGNFIRERIRKAALRVFNAGGSVQAGAAAAIKEMQQHVKFMPPSPQRIEKIRSEQWEVVGKFYGDPDSIDAMDAEDAESIAKMCPDIQPS